MPVVATINPNKNKPYIGRFEMISRKSYRAGDTLHSDSRCKYVREQTSVTQLSLEEWRKWLTSKCVAIVSKV